MTRPFFFLAPSHCNRICLTLFLGGAFGNVKLSIGIFRIKKILQTLLMIYWRHEIYVKSLLIMVFNFINLLTEYFLLYSAYKDLKQFTYFIIFHLVIMTVKKLCLFSIILQSLIVFSFLSLTIQLMVFLFKIDLSYLLNVYMLYQQPKFNYSFCTYIL